MSKSQKTIVLAEDDPQLRELYCLILENEGFSVISAQDGEEAIAATIAHRPDMVILDIMMPKMDGLTALKNLKENEEVKHIPIIILSALQNVRHQNTARDLGATDYLIKAKMDYESLIRKIKGFLNVKV